MLPSRLRFQPGLLDRWKAVQPASEPSEEQEHDNACDAHAKKVQEGRLIF